MIRRVCSVCATSLVLAGCSGVQSPLAPGGDQASALYSLLWLMLAVCGVVYLLVMAGLTWAIWRARRRRLTAGEAREPSARTLPAAATGIVAGLTVLILGSFWADRALFAARGDKAMLVRVTGHQWWWRIQYRDSDTGRWIETANELHLPAGRTTTISLGAADVIHSFWVPNVAGKLDMVPGRRNMIDVTPRRIGWFRGQCAEFCGTQHAHMAFDVKVEPETEFRAWLAAQRNPAAASASSGAATFAQSCATCHSIRGTPADGRAGPDLTHVAARRSIAAGTLMLTRGNLQGWVAQPQAIKPGTTMPAVPLTPAQANAVATYIMALK